MSAVLRLVHSAEPTARPEAPRMQDGFIRIPNGLFDALLSADIPARHLKVALAVIRKTYGFGKQSDDVTITQLAEVAGIHRPDASKAFQALLAANIVSASKGRHGSVVSINAPEMWDFTPYQNATVSATNVADCYGQTSQNATHNRQLQKTVITSSLRSEVVDVPEKRVSKAKPPVVPCQQVLDAYNAELGDSLPRAQMLNDKRQKAIGARWKQMLGTTNPAGKLRFDDTASGIEWFAKLFRKVRMNPHWMGENEDATWTASFDWIMGPENFMKVLEYRQAGRGNA
ncbi:replication protein [Chitinimonas arctica]|uniref:Replication protein n=1 Tax=Chitinimonas arctica TaxID=2594795 RepID=A0A516SCW4_9NEIS|nr:replication protein [Chitinimonas arctica]QDQ25980.1 replication protein [Chitinimonas arctica]